MRVQIHTTVWSTALVVLGLTAGLARAEDFEDKVSKTFRVSEGGVLVVDASRGSIEVRTRDGGSVQVDVIRKVKGGSRSDAEEILEEYRIDLDQRGNDVIVRAGQNDRNFWDRMRNRLQVRFIITVPRRYNVDLKTSGGSISVEDLAGEVLAETSGGSLTFGRVDGRVRGRTSGGSIQLAASNGPADVETSGGSITIGRVRGDVIARTSGGSISVEEVEGDIEAKTSGGGVTARLTRQPRGDCRLETSGGSVTVFLAEDIGVEVDAATSGGRVVSDFPVRVQGEMSRTKLQADLNGGGPLLRLRTSGGSIHLREL